jgi:uroporphyrinogen-III synthase
LTNARPVWVLRPEPGNAATCARLTEMGFAPVPLSLFVVEPAAWDVPNAADFDALLLTSANAVRHAGAGIQALVTLPMYAVGDSTARAARAVGLSIAATGTGGVADMAERLAQDGRGRVLHLTGHDFTALPDGFAPTVRIVYAARERGQTEVLPAMTAAPRPAHVLLHSARAARRLTALVQAAGLVAGVTAGLAQSDLIIHALSRVIADAAGEGWGGKTVAKSPNEAALLSALQKSC